MNLESSKRGDLMLNKRSHDSEHMKQTSTSNAINTYTTICLTDALLKDAELGPVVRKVDNLSSG